MNFVKSANLGRNEIHKMASPLTKITDEEKISTAESYKLEGNDFFKAKNLKKAMGKYHRAILQLKGVGQDKNVGVIMGLTKPTNDNLSKDLEAQFTKLKTDCYNNLAACLLQEESPNYNKVLNYCLEVLSVSPGNTKALHRQGVALYHLHKYEEAQESLLKADQKDSSTKRYLLMCKKAIEKQEIELQAIYKAMFGGGSKGGGSKQNSLNRTEKGCTNSNLENSDCKMNGQTNTTCSNGEEKT